MDEGALVEKFLQINKNLYAKAKNPLRSHGPGHHLRVCRNAIKLAKRLNLKVDPEVLIPAALLHDLAAYYPEKSGENYHDWDHVLAKEVLEKNDFPKDKIRLVLEVIKNHGSDPKFKDKEELAEVSVLRDADKFDSFGVIGVARIVMARTQKGDSLEQIVKDFYTDGHLQRKYDSITFQEAKEMVMMEYVYSLNFFKMLAEKLGEK